MGLIIRIFAYTHTSGACVCLCVCAPYSHNKIENLDLLVCLEQQQRFKDIKRLRDHTTDTAKNFKIDGHCGTVSFITSMTEHFCSGCNRLRLLSDGNFKVCLFGPSEVS